LAFECRERIAGSDKILINSSSRCMFFSPILFPELSVSNEVVFIRAFVQTARTLAAQSMRGLLMLSAYFRQTDGEIDNAPRYSKTDRVVGQAPSCFLTAFLLQRVSRQ
jgi:hypothetical protein